MIPTNHPIPHSADVCGALKGVIYFSVIRLGKDTIFPPTHSLHLRFPAYLQVLHDTVATLREHRSVRQVEQALELLLVLDGSVELPALLRLNLHTENGLRCLQND